MKEGDESLIDALSWIWSVVISGGVDVKCSLSTGLDDLRGGVCFLLPISFEIFPLARYVLYSYLSRPDRPISTG